MNKIEMTVRFTTPAFLGNAEQNGQWRTPPFKALIRQWWRVAHASKVNYDVARLRHDEAALFGSASDATGGESGKSLVRMRLDRWSPGSLEQWQPCGTVRHPEVGQSGQNVGADLYLGYGPLGYERHRGTVLSTVKGMGTKRTAVEVNRVSATLRLYFPDDCEPELRQVIQLIVWFGTLGSRSRNGWGSLDIDSESIEPLTRAALIGFSRPLEKCLHLEWAHAIGSDAQGHPLVWTTKPGRDWREVMKELAGIKIALRTEPQLLSLTGKPDGNVSARHVLAYPLTNHAALGPVDVQANEAGWVDLDKQTKRPKTDKHGKYIQSVRLANQIRFKVAKADRNKFRGTIVHLPCKVPDELVNKLSSTDQKFIRNNELAVWQAVHNVLDREAMRLA